MSFEARLAASKHRILGQVHLTHRAAPGCERTLYDRVLCRKQSSLLGAQRKDANQCRSWRSV